jgi:hypothetical protein
MSSFEQDPENKLVIDSELKPDLNTNILKCQSCEIIITLETAFSCEFCNRDNDDNDNDNDNDDDEEKEKNVRSLDQKPRLFCKKCTLNCDACRIKGCKECVEFVCCDCGYDMCIECRNNEVDCGCYGHCCSCWVDINRGSEGWPCGECKKWYCRGCIQCDNPCKYCGPEEEEEDEEDTN